MAERATHCRKTDEHYVGCSNLGGDYIGGSQDEDYSYDQTKRMFVHKGEVNTLDTDQVVIPFPPLLDPLQCDPER
eukprot:2012737-Rhodomonas_salina.4